MKVKSIEILEARAVNFDSKTGEIKVLVVFNSDTPLITFININDSHEKMASSILSAVKHQKKPVDDDDDEILGGIGIINIANEEDFAERLGKGVLRLEQRYENLRRTRNASDYMRAYSQLSTSEEIIYKK